MFAAIGEIPVTGYCFLVRFTNYAYKDNGMSTKFLLPGIIERIYDYDALGNLVQAINATGLQMEMI